MLQGLPRHERKARSRGAARARRAHRGGRPQGRRLLGRHEAPPRPRAGARPPSAGHLPRRADDRARPAEPHAPSGTRWRASRGRTGVTVFLTTQYLEEADVLADRVGIIDHGRIVAEGTPTALKAEIGRPSVHAIPAVADDRVRILALLDRFGEPFGDGELAVRLDEGVGLADVVRGDRRRGARARDVELRAPTLDDVFLAKTGRTLEGAARRTRSPPRAPAMTGRGTAPRLGAGTPSPRSPRSRAARSGGRPPAGDGDPAAHLPRRADARERGGARAVDAAPRLPDRLVPRVRARRPVHPGRALRDDERGHRLRAGHPDRLPQPALAHVAARLVASRGPARRDRRARARAGRLLRRRRAPRRRPLRLRPGRRPRDPRLRRARLARVRRARGRSSRCGRGAARRSRGCSRCSSSSSSSRR